MYYENYYILRKKDPAFCRPCAESKQGEMMGQLLEKRMQQFT